MNFSRKQVYFSQINLNSGGCSNIKDNSKLDTDVLLKIGAGVNSNSFENFTTCHHLSPFPSYIDDFDKTCLVPCYYQHPKKISYLNKHPKIGKNRLLRKSVKLKNRCIMLMAIKIKIIYNFGIFEGPTSPSFVFSGRWVPPVLHSPFYFNLAFIASEF